MDKTKTANVVAFANQKGGVGKTTTVANTGVAFGMKGYKVLLVDFDPQANLTAGFGINTDRLTSTIGTLLESSLRGHKIQDDITQFCLPTGEGVDLLPCDIGLADTELTLSGAMGREIQLKPIIDKLRPYYEYIFIDCQPTMASLTTNALVAADGVVIPCEPAFFSAKGVQGLFAHIQRTKMLFNNNLKIHGLLITKTPTQSRNAREIAAEVKDAYNEEIPLFETSIPRSVRVPESNNHGKSIISYDPKSKVAQAYMAFAEELEERVNEE